MPWLTGDEIPVDSFCRVIRVPNDPTFIHAVSGALLDLTYAQNWEQHGLLTPQEQADAFDQIYIEFTQEMCIEADDLIYPKSFMAFGHQAKMVGSGALSHIFLNTLQFSQYTRVVTPYINNEYQFEVLLAKGNWNFNYMSLTNNSSGHVRLRVDGVDTQYINDYYSATQLVNQISQNNQPIAISTDGIHTVGFKMAAKNASSSNYNHWLQALWGHWVSAI